MTLLARACIAALGGASAGRVRVRDGAEDRSTAVRAAGPDGTTTAGFTSAACGAVRALASAEVARGPRADACIAVLGRPIVDDVVGRASSVRPLPVASGGEVDPGEPPVTAGMKLVSPP